MHLRIVFLVCSLCLAISAGPARAQHADLEIEIEGGRLVTNERIAEGEFGEDGNPANVADEPGLEVDDGVFAASQALEFQATPISLGSHQRNLWFWNGAGPVAFDTAADALTIEHPVTGAAITLDSNPGATTVPGFLVALADDEGGIHQDLEFVLGQSAPQPGVYLFGLEFLSDGYVTSEPVYFVLGSGVGEDTIDMAVGYVNSTLVIPEPASAWLAFGGVLLCGRLRTRARRSNTAAP